jgi:hypothetical protein
LYAAYAEGDGAERDFSGIVRTIREQSAGERSAGVQSAGVQSAPNTAEDGERA